MLKNVGKVEKIALVVIALFMLPICAGMGSKSGKSRSRDYVELGSTCQIAKTTIGVSSETTLKEVGELVGKAKARGFGSEDATMRALADPGYRSLSAGEVVKVYDYGTGFSGHDYVRVALDDGSRLWTYRGALTGCTKL